MSTNRFTSRLENDQEYRRTELITKIEKVVEQMTLPELEALVYDLFSKGKEI
ncbi:MAG: hypothetical protein PUD15_02495 [Prevotella sp.]|uniref:hypothetical protein n=1 Tax=Prevotella sp. AGR2160 TaxID=1280674 RepID=UPI00041805BE|nr:hypothetical protein [Prevotella sp. AGR2160]MDD5861414.1 hypothetical protein [Prevotella sp.]